MTKYSPAEPSGRSMKDDIQAPPRAPSPFEVLVCPRPILNLPLLHRAGGSAAWRGAMLADVIPDFIQIRDHSLGGEPMARRAVVPHDQRDVVQFAERAVYLGVMLPDEVES